MRTIYLPAEDKKRVLDRLEQIEKNAKNYFGYYVLEEEKQITIFCNLYNLSKLKRYLQARKGYFSYSCTYFANHITHVYDGIPVITKYAYHITINKTAKKTIENLKKYLLF